ncbi:MAG TPA: hypothetical protein VH740_26785 [Vicinamibacterales bacterium]|jgi:hypothetical protein
MRTVTLAVALLCSFIMLTAAVALEPAKVAGKWNGRLQLESVSGSPVLTFKQDGEKLTGTYQGYYGVTPLEGTIKEKEIAFAVTFNIEGTKTQGIFTGTVDGDSMGGRVEFEGAGSGTWSAVRAKE